MEAASVLDNQAYDRAVYERYVKAKRSHVVERDHRCTLAAIGNLIESGGRDLFDLGAGAGDFLAVARQCGFAPHGNELAPGAIEMARHVTGIELHAGDLDTIAGAELYDAVTMWCVLAHVTDPDTLLRHTLRVLKPGGVLFLQTPRWSAMDAIALAGSRVSGGRVSRVLDRRVNDYHMTLNTERGLAAQLARTGFEVIQVHSRVRFSLTTQVYLEQLGVPPRVGAAMAKVLDLAVERGLMARNVLDLYARKPEA